jgi:hypothetical protein
MAICHCMRLNNKTRVAAFNAALASRQGAKRGRGKVLQAIFAMMIHFEHCGMGISTRELELCRLTL